MPEEQNKPRHAGNGESTRTERYTPRHGRGIVSRIERAKPAGR